MRRLDERVHLGFRRQLVHTFAAAILGQAWSAARPCMSPLQSHVAQVRDDTLDG